MALLIRDFPNLKAAIRATYDAYAPRYDRVLGIMEALGMRRRRNALLALARGRVLEVAVGTGLNLGHYPPGCALTAIDFSPVMLRHAREKAGARGLRLHLNLMDAEQLGFADGSFDTVVSTLSSCTFPDPVAAFREMGRVVKPGGRVLLIEQGYSDRPWVRRLQDLQARRQFEWLGCRWQREPDRQALEAGLRIESDERMWLGMVHVLCLRPPGD